MATITQFDEIRTKESTYKATINCMNCGHTHVATLQKGVPIMQADPKCPTCGCSNQQMNKVWGNNMSGGVKI